MLFLASKKDEIFENIDGSEYKSRYQVPFGQLNLWRKQLLGSRQHQKFMTRYSKFGLLGGSLGDVSFLPLLCSVVGCDSEATHGAHIRSSDRRKKQQFIVPLCPSCNARQDSFHLKPITPMLILGSASSKNKKNIDFTEVKIRFLHHSTILDIPSIQGTKP
jgi:hypothetical protein